MEQLSLNGVFGELLIKRFDTDSVGYHKENPNLFLWVGQYFRVLSFLSASCIGGE